MTSQPAGNPGRLTFADNGSADWRALWVVSRGLSSQRRRPAGAGAASPLGVGPGARTRKQVPSVAMADPRESGLFRFLSLGLAAGWLGVGLAWPGRYHLVALAVGAGVGVGHRLGGSGRLSVGAALGSGVSGVINAGVASAVLAASENLRGSYLPAMGPLAEALVFSAIGGVFGFSVARFR